MEQTFGLRQLGQSKLMVSPLGLGTWQFSKRKGIVGKYWTDLTDEEIAKIIGESRKGGINWIDTAEIYGRGESERAVARALKQLGVKPGEVIIATKWWPLFRFAGNMERTIDQRLEALGGYPIDLYQVHQPFSFSRVAEEMNSMGRLAKHGKIRYIGVSNFSAAQMERAYEELSPYGMKLISNQVQYNLLNRKIESNGIMDKAKELGISIIAYSPLAQGLLTGKFHDNPSLLENIGLRKNLPGFKKKGLARTLPLIIKLREIAGAHQVTPAQVALNWLVNFHGSIVFAIPGATKQSHAMDNTGAMKFVLSQEELRAIDTASLAIE